MAEPELQFAIARISAHGGVLTQQIAAALGDDVRTLSACQNIATALRLTLEIL